MASPTTEDAHLYLQLLDIAQGQALSEALRWVVSDFEASSYEELETKYPAGSADRATLVRALGFFESAGVLVSRGLLHEDVFFDAPLGLEIAWEKIEPVLAGWQQAGGPAAWENLEWLGRRYTAWRESEWKPKLEAVPPGQRPVKLWGEDSGHQVGFSAGKPAG